MTGTTCLLGCCLFYTERMRADLYDFMFMMIYWQILCIMVGKCEREARLASEQIFFSGNARNGSRTDAGREPTPGPLFPVLALRMCALHANSAQVPSYPARKSFKIMLNCECKNRKVESKCTCLIEYPVLGNLESVLKWNRFSIPNPSKKWHS